MSDEEHLKSITLAFRKGRGMRVLRGYTGRGRGGAGEERKGGDSGESCESDRVVEGVHAGS